MVLFGYRVQKGQLVVGEERVRNPDLFGEITSQGHVVFVVVRERQTLVLPVLVQIDRDRVILRKECDFIRLLSACFIRIHTDLYRVHFCILTCYSYMNWLRSVNLYDL